MKNSNWILSLSFFCTLYGTGQELSQSLEEVQVVHLKKENNITQQLNKSEIKALQPEDAGQLMQKFAGVTLKSYGGLGGMKTISVRGIGGSHTAIVMDGFIIQNNQTGQVDLSNIQSENLESVSISMGGADGNLLPVSAYLGGSTLSFQTFENRFSADSLQIRASLKGGSYGQMDSYLALKLNRRKYFLSVFGKYRQADGTYPFEFENGMQTYKGNRYNADLKEGFGGIGSGFRLTKKSILKINYQFNQSNKGLPGAVILYNPTAVQRLKNESHQLNADYRFVGSKIGIRSYVSARYEDLNYIDRGYLNEAGFLDQDFYNASIQHGIVFQTQERRDSSDTKRLKYNFFGGIEQNYNELHSSIANFAQPRRYHLKSVAGTELQWQKVRTVIQLGGQAVFDQNQLATPAKNKYIFTPYFLLEAKNKIAFLGRPVFWAKRSFRMPTFNELYYNGIGNTKLKPEIANQFNIGTRYELNAGTHYFTFNLDGYFNLVENKIVAIPTKNLFIWSMQNVGQAQILGADFQFSYAYQWKQWVFSSRINYTFQQVQDLTDKSSATYGDQLPYLPKHTGNVDLTVSYQKTGISLSGLMTSERYALNENIPTNRIDSFFVMDISAFHTFSLKKTQQLRLSVSAKNILNETYAFVRYYVMPGTNFLISLNYEFH